MASSGSSRSIAMRVVDELADFSAETARTCIAHLNVMICEMEAMDDRFEDKDPRSNSTQSESLNEETIKVHAETRGAASRLEE
ncbi:hypothetical protein Tco_0387300 [Tanacetum coccineum]